jgi:RNA polymerase sigma-70 factor (ECF subfamily)
VDFGLAGRVLISDNSGEGTRMADPEYALIKAIAGGDQEAFERLVKRYQNPLYNFVYRHLGDRALAEDITQETFLRIYRSAPRFEPRARVSTWIFKMAFNLSLNESERRGRLQLRETPITDEHQCADGSSAAAVAKFELEQQITGLLDRLPDRQRAALLLRVNEGLSYREIAEVLGISVQSVESLIFRARQQLRGVARSMRTEQKE